jgi:hypothetical protein
MNMEIGTEAAQFPEKECLNGAFVAVWDTARFVSGTFWHDIGCVWVYCTCEVVERDEELGRDLGDDIAGEAALEEGGLPHQVVHRVRHLHQLAVRQVWKPTK